MMKQASHLKKTDPQLVQLETAMLNGACTSNAVTSLLENSDALFELLDQVPYDYPSDRVVESYLHSKVRACCISKADINLCRSEQAAAIETWMRARVQSIRYDLVNMLHHINSDWCHTLTMDRTLTPNLLERIYKVSPEQGADYLQGMEVEMHDLVIEMQAAIAKNGNHHSHQVWEHYDRIRPVLRHEMYKRLWERAKFYIRDDKTKEYAKALVKFINLCCMEDGNSRLKDACVGSSEVETMEPHEVLFMADPIYAFTAYYPMVKNYNQQSAEALESLAALQLCVVYQLCMAAEKRESIEPAISCYYKD